MKVIIFENDADFEAYAIDPTYRIKTSDKGTQYYNWSFTDAYTTETANGSKFLIKERNSKIVKRGCVTHGTISKKVNNVFRYSKLELLLLDSNDEVVDYSEKNDDKESQ